MGRGDTEGSRDRMEKKERRESIETLKKQIVSFLIMIVDYFSPIVFLFLAVPVNRGGSGVGEGSNAAFVRYPD